MDGVSFFRNVAVSFFIGIFSLISSPDSAVAQPIQCGTSAEADIVIMIDRTGSINSTDMNNQQIGAKTLLNFFNGATVKPQVAIGSFNVQTGADARIHAGLTQTYGVNDTETPTPDTSTGLYKAINDLDNATGEMGNGTTDLSAALIVAKNELDNGTVPNRFIIIISDGITNQPAGSVPSACSGGNPGAAANAAANAAEFAGYKIITIHYGDDSGCSIGTGVNFLMNQIASTPGAYFEGNLPATLSGVFAEISQSLTCDDGNACTVDSCDTQQNPPMCVFTPIGLDSDNDGVPDCNDVCPGGNDNEIGDSCVAQVGTCSNSGYKICVVNHIECNAQVPTSGPEVCDGMDNDCDGMVDEGFQIGGSCMVGVGQCMNTGQYICNGPNANICNATPGNTGIEVCNNLDDDCDGSVDEGSVCNCTGIIDDCGVCNGNNSAKDICGVCFGNNSTCENICQQTVITSTLTALDGLALDYFKFTKKIAKNIKAVTGTQDSSVSALLAESEALFTQNWTLTWTIPQVLQTNCTFGSSCVAISHVDELTGYQINHIQFGEIASTLIKKLKKLVGKTEKIKKLNKKNKSLQAKDDPLVASIPPSSQSCS